MDLPVYVRSQPFTAARLPTVRCLLQLSCHLSWPRQNGAPPSCYGRVCMCVELKRVSIPGGDGLSCSAVSPRVAVRAFMTLHQTTTRPAIVPVHDVTDHRRHRKAFEYWPVTKRIRPSLTYGTQRVRTRAAYGTFSRLHS